MPQPAQPTTQPPVQPAHPDTPIDNHCAAHRREDRPKLRWAFLIGLFVLVVAVLIIGVVFTVYYDALYYSNGAYMLKDKTGGIQAKVESNPEKTQDGILSKGGDMGACPEEQDSCQAYDQPNICCPTGTICHSSPFSSSGIFCCSYDDSCLVTAEQPPRCADKSRACGKSLGGGCCPPETECAADGCLKVYRAAPGFASTVLSGTEIPHEVPTLSVVMPSATKTAGAEKDGVTVTTVKIGETAGLGFSVSRLKICAGREGRRFEEGIVG
ncbi:hypothetical protein M434DRAFT_389658 [Hypoxylon sp. CO27-5]|nr:hypothetical protein M434DRAFT_389658 [Hypoxylon sp. CO27-5]